MKYLLALDQSTVSAQNGETTAMGAAYLAGLGVGYFTSTDEIASQWAAGKSFEPRMSQDQRGALRSGWSKVLHGTKSDLHGNLP
jgi:glycerol kinase